MSGTGSIQLPTIKIDRNQTFGTPDAAQVDIRYYDGKLYICKVTNGFVTEGAELVLDELPAGASDAGAQGTSQVIVITGETEIAFPTDYTGTPDDTVIDDFKTQYLQRLYGEVPAEAKVDLQAEFFPLVTA